MQSVRLTLNQIMRLANFRQLNDLHIDYSGESFHLWLPADSDEDHKLDLLAADIFELTGRSAVELPEVPDEVAHDNMTPFLCLNLRTGNAYCYKIRGELWAETNNDVDLVKVYILAQSIKALAPKDFARLFRMVSGTQFIPTKPTKNSLLILNFFTGESGISHTPPKPIGPVDIEIRRLYDEYQKFTDAEREALGKYVRYFAPEVIIYERMHHLQPN